MSELPPPFAGKKLVIWDLDDCLWSGTLAEGGVIRRPHYEKLFHAMALAGLLQSVASNNDQRVAMAEIDRLGLVPYLLFPQFGWGSKPGMVRRIVELTQLRPSQAVFIDDNARLRSQIEREVGVIGVDPDRLLAIGPDEIAAVDPNLVAVRRYRVLERRHEARAPTESDDSQFLRRCGITLSVEPAEGHGGRIVDLVARAHQLNFTKEPLDGVTLAGLCADPLIRTGAVHVQDRFGDYGVSGFFAEDLRSGRLLHFVFSCRVLNMGIEQFMYRHLGAPAISVREPVASDLAHGPAPDWIRLVERLSVRSPWNGRQARTRILLKGGCDLQLVAGYLGPEHDLVTEVLTVEEGVQRYGHSALSVLAAVAEGANTDVLDRIPWLRGWETVLFGGELDRVFLSLWVDYACLTYRHRRTGLRIPAYATLTAQSSEETWQQWWGSDTTERAWFLAEFEPAPALTPGELSTGLARLREIVPNRTGVTVLNAPEVETPRRYEWDELQHARHKALNEAVDRAATALGAGLIDMRHLVTSSADLHQTDDRSLMHYARHVYLALARMIGSDTDRGLLENHIGGQSRSAEQAGQATGGTDGFINPGTGHRRAHWRRRLEPQEFR